MTSSPTIKKTDSDTISVKVKVRKNDFTLNIDTYFPHSRITAIYGKSGSGKTTLLRAIAGFEKHSDSNIYVGEQCWQSSSFYLPAHKRLANLVTQESHLFPHLTVNKNLEFSLRRSKKRENQISISECASELGISDLLNKVPNELSRGQQQRVALARGILSCAKLLLLDEPLANLDNQAKHSILAYIERIQRQQSTTILYVSHSNDEVLRIADQMLILENGHILAKGKPNELCTDDTLPLARKSNASSIVEGVLHEHLADYHLSKVRLSSGQFLLVPVINSNTGCRIKLRVHASDVSINLQQEKKSSINNILEARIEHIFESDTPSHIIVRLSLGKDLVLAQVTKYSAHKLGLRVNMLVYIQIKSVVLLY